MITTFYGEHFSVRDERWRYIRYSDGSDELYDLKEDPNEWTNLAGRAEHAAVQQRLAAVVPKDPIKVEESAAPARKKRK